MAEKMRRPNNNKNRKFKKVSERNKKIKNLLDRAQTQSNCSKREREREREREKKERKKLRVSLLLQTERIDKNEIFKIQKTGPIKIGIENSF